MKYFHWLKKKKLPKTLSFEQLQKIIAKGGARDLTEEEKNEVVNEFMRLMGKHCMEAMLMFNLKTHMEATMVNDNNGGSMAILI